MLTQKGQESAPFELLVAVIVMTFVLLAGYNVLSILTSERCKGELDNNIETLKTAIEAVAQNEGQRSIAFSFPDCFKQNTNPPTELKIINITERQICAEICPGARTECMLLEFSNPKHGVRKCLRISSATEFPTADNICNDFGNPEEYTPHRWRVKPIEEGQYVLIKKFNEFTEQPMICAYKRVI